MPPDELVVNLRQRMAGLPPQDLSGFVDLFHVIKRKVDVEGLRLEAEGLEAEGFIKLIARAQELDRRAGRPVKKDMTTGDAVARLEESGELDALNLGYLRSAMNDAIWIPKEVE